MSETLKTFGDVVGEVQQYGFADGSLVYKARIERWVNECQFRLARDIESDDFQENGTVATVVGTTEYALPTGCLRILSIRLPELSRRLRPMTVRELDNLSPEVTGPPERYTVWKNKLILYPKPEAVESLTVRYIKEPAELTAEANVPTLNRQYLHLLVDYAVSRAFRAENDYEAAKMHEEKYREDRAAYAADTQSQIVDKPKQLEGTWGMI